MIKSYYWPATICLSSRCLFLTGICVSNKSFWDFLLRKMLMASWKLQISDCLRCLGYIEVDVRLCCDCQAGTWDIEMADPYNQYACKHKKLEICGFSPFDNSLQTYFQIVEEWIPSFLRTASLSSNLLKTILQKIFPKILFPNPSKDK